MDPYKPTQIAPLFSKVFFVIAYEVSFSDECSDQTKLPLPSESCGVVEGWTPLNTAMLQGVWYAVLQVLIKSELWPKI